MVCGWLFKGSLGKTGEELPDTWEVGRGNIYESMEEYLPLWKMPLDWLLLKGITQEKEERRVLNSQDEPIVKMKRILLRFLDFFSYWMGFFTHGKQGSIAIYLIICFSFAKAYVCLGLKLKEINKSLDWQYFLKRQK